MALMFLILFGTLAVGFYGATTMSVQVAKNDRDAAVAQITAESGMKFMRRFLAQVSFPPTTLMANVPAEVHADLSAMLEGGGNLGTRTLSRSGNRIWIPPIPVGDGSSFTATLQWNAPIMVLTVTGTRPAAAAAGATPVTRSVQMDYRLRNIMAEPLPYTDVLSFGVAARGPIFLKNTSSTEVAGSLDDASLLSASTGSPAITTGAGVINGELHVVSAATQVTLGTGAVAGDLGAARLDNIYVVPPPTFPTVDTTPFAALATNLFVVGLPYQKNVSVPPGLNPIIAGGSVIDGIMYVRSPNVVTFAGHAQINGIIVFENAGTSAVNQLNFQGNITQSAIPATAEFAAVRAAGVGISVLAPTAAIAMTGTSDGLLEGSLFGYSVSLTGNANVTFKNGSIVSMGPGVANIAGKTLRFNGTGANFLPVTGVTLAPRPYNQCLISVPTSYREVTE
jgi:hypothetical protein